MMNLVAEDLLLLGLNGEKGSIYSSSSMALPYGLAGSLLVELTMKNRLTMQKKKIIVNDESDVEDEILNEAFTLIKQSRKSRDAKYWVNYLNRKMNKLQDRLFERLVNKNVVTKEQRHFLWIFQFQYYPLIDRRKKDLLKRQIREAVFSYTNNGEERELILSNLVYACELIKHVFPKDEQKEAKKRLKLLAKNEAYGSAVSESVQAVQVALMASIIAATAVTAATTTSSS